MGKKLLRCLAMTLALMLALCVCGLSEEALVEFETLSLGMSGEEVENLNARLTVLGYLNEALIADYDELTEEAVKAFQTAAGIEATGVADAATQQALLAEKAPVNPDNPPAGEMVWIPKSGSKYHVKWDCGNMKGPSCVTVEDAVAQGYTPCSRCCPAEEEAE